MDYLRKLRERKVLKTKGKFSITSRKKRKLSSKKIKEIAI